MALGPIGLGRMGGFVSRQEDSPSMKMIAALRNQFGGHAVLPEDD